MKKVSITLIVLAVVAVAIWFYFMRSAPVEQGYITQPPMRGSIERTVLASGMLQASKLVSVGAQVSGQIERFDVSLGDEVKQGDFIAQIDNLSQQNELKQAQASLTSLNAQYRSKQAQIKQAQSEFNRQKGMLAAKASSRANYESALANLTIYKADLEQLQAEIEKAKINVDTAEIDLGYTTITAPMDGTVVYTAVSEGQTLNFNQSTPTIVELADLRTMTVKAQISEADVIHVKAGQEAYLSILGQTNKRYKSKVRAIEPGPTIMDGDDANMTISDSDAIYYHALFDVENPEGILRIGMTTEVSIVLEKSDDALLVPAQVLIDLGDGNYQVPVLENGQVVNKDVTIGINNRINVEILSGLEEDDEVVIGGGANDFMMEMGPPRGMGF